MLKFFNRLEKTRNFVLILFAVVMAASLILFYAPTRDAVATDPARSTEIAATVAGDDESVVDVPSGGAANDERGVLNGRGLVDAQR